MRYTVIQPAEELKGFISHFWTGTWDPMSQEANTSHYVIANSLVEITFAFDSLDKNANLLFSLVQGNTNQPDHFDVEGYFHLIGVSFYSYAIPYLFKISTSELNGELFSLNTFLSKDGNLLNEKMALGTNTLERIKILSNYFISLLHSQIEVDTVMLLAVKEIKSFEGNLKIEELAKQFCLSQKQFGRRFKDFTGFSPKLYSRILRFESVIQNYSSSSSLTEMALANGYFDQAHFNHEFKEFSGFRPKDFWRLAEG